VKNISAWAIRDPVALGEPRDALSDDRSDYAGAAQSSQFILCALR
jgi:hypothetical protein